MTKARAGIAVPIVVTGIVLAGLVVATMVSYSMQSTRHADMTLNKKSAYFAAEAGLNFATKELMKTPFFSRFILKDFVEAARQGMGRPANQVGQIPADWAKRTYGPIDRGTCKQTGGLGWAQLTGSHGDSGMFEVTLVEHLSQDFVTEKAGLPGKGAVDPVKARLDHIAVYSKGWYDDPSTGPTAALVTAKIVFRPEPFVFEYDSNGDGISNPMKLPQVTEKGKKVPPPSATQGKISDLCFHPFLDEGRYAVWGSGNFQSAPPTNISVIKSRVFYQTVRSGDTVKEIRKLDFGSNAALAMPNGPLTADFMKNSAVANNDRAFIQKMLKEDNLQFVANFGVNKPVRDAFAAPTQAKDVVPAGSQDVTQAQIEGLVDGAAGGRLGAPVAVADPSKNLQDWIDGYTKTLPNYAGQTVYGNGIGQAELQLVEDTSLGKADNTAKNLGRVFQIPAAEIQRLNKLMEAFRANQIKNGNDLLAFQEADKKSKPVGHIEDLSGTQEFYAPVLYPRGKLIKKMDQVPDGNAIPDLNGDNKCQQNEIDAYMAQHPELGGKPPMISKEVYSVDNYFVDKLRGPLMDDASAGVLYGEMQATVAEIKANAEAAKSYDAELSERPPSYAQLEHAIILKAQADPVTKQKDPRLDIRLSDALKESLKWVEVPGPENGESGEVAPVAVAVGLTYSMKWLCFCKDNAETEDEKPREGKRSASTGGVAR